MSNHVPLLCAIIMWRSRAGILTQSRMSPRHLYILIHPEKSRIWWVMCPVAGLPPQHMHRPHRPFISQLPKSQRQSETRRSDRVEVQCRRKRRRRSMHGLTGLPLAERLQIWAQSCVVLRRSHHFMIVGQPASIIRLTYSCTYASLSMAHRCDIASTWVASCGQTTWQQVRPCVACWPCVACACAKLAAYLPAKREPLDAL